MDHKTQALQTSPELTLHPDHSVGAGQCCLLCRKDGRRLAGYPYSRAKSKKIYPNFVRVLHGHAPAQTGKYGEFEKFKRPKRTIQSSNSRSTADIAKSSGATTGKFLACIRESGQLSTKPRERGRDQLDFIPPHTDRSPTKSGARITRPALI